MSQSGSRPLLAINSDSDESSSAAQKVQDHDATVSSINSTASTGEPVSVNQLGALSQHVVNSTSTGITLILFDKYPKSPPEIRAKILAVAINVPRLLETSYAKPYGALRSRLGRDFQFPPVFFMNKEAYGEIAKIIRTTPATERYDDWYHWPYINPAYDVVFSRCWSELPYGRNMPGLRTFAVENGPNWRSFLVWKWRLKVFPGIGSLLWDCPRLVGCLPTLPDPKELLLIRYYEHLPISTIPARYLLQRQYPHKVQSSNLVKHPCGLFDSLHDEVEELLADGVAESETMSDEHLRYEYFFDRPSKDIAKSFVRVATRVISREHPGTILPKISVVYLQFWVNGTE